MLKENLPILYSGFVAILIINNLHKNKVRKLNYESIISTGK